MTSHRVRLSPTGALVAAWFLFPPCLAPAGAQPAPQHLFHVTHDTYGCTNPRATLAITNRDDPRQQDPGWVGFVVSDGHCAPITPRSPWRLVSLRGELAFMTYAGTTGIPGSFYLRASELAELPQEPAPGAGDLPLPAPASAEINPPDAATPNPAPLQAPERPSTLPLAAREQPRPSTQPSTAATPARDASGDGRLAGAALAAIIVIACGFRAKRPKDGSGRRSR